MISWLKELDRVLRGEATKLSELRHGSIEIRLFGLTVIIIGLGLIYGVCMGCFSLLRINDLSPENLYQLQIGAYQFSVPRQLLASTVKGSTPVLLDTDCYVSVAVRLQCIGRFATVDCIRSKTIDRIARCKSCRTCFDGNDYGVF